MSVRVLVLQSCNESKWDSSGFDPYFTQRQPGQFRRQPRNLAVVDQYEINGIFDDTVDQPAAAEEAAGGSGDYKRLNACHYCQSLCSQCRFRDAHTQSHCLLLVYTAVEILVLASIRTLPTHELPS